MLVEKEVEEKEETYGWRNFAYSYLFLGAIYFAFWSLFCFAEWEIINPFETREGRFIFGMFVLWATAFGFICYIKETADED